MFVRKVFFLLMLTPILIGSGYAQLGNRFASVDAVLIAQTTTLFILDNKVQGKESAYNDAIRDAAEKYWRLNNFDFKRNSEVDDFIPAEGYSMIVKSFREVQNADKFTSQIHNDISLMLCNKDSIQFYGGVDEIASVNIAKVDNPEAILYKLPIILKSMQAYIRYMSQKGGDIHNYQKVVAGYVTRYNKRLKKQTLYICKEELPVTIDPEKIKQIYQFPMVVTDKSALKKIIDADTPDAALLHFDPGFKKIWIMEIRSGDLLYAGLPEKKGHIIEKDFREIRKAAK